MQFGKHLGQIMLGATLVLVGCATTDEAPKSSTQGETPVAKRSAHRGVSTPPSASLDAYKQQVAQRIYDTNSDTFSGLLPPMLKSVVVLDVTLDDRGKATRVVVRRSNGFKKLERVALDSVRKAGDFPEPSAKVLAGGKSVTYLETWLFRADGKFQIRSLVTEPQPGHEALAQR
ncbi:MAG TPA: TonB family protein [Burkholderiales bacterium]|jgi:Gram-negative bacterial tonB protein.